jgi:N-acetylmuramoyl-L-alanine amidase.
VRLSIMCRHTVGLNWAAIGIEHVGMSDAQVLGNGPQLRSSLALTVWLMARYHIPLRRRDRPQREPVEPLHKELYAPWRCQTHADWRAPT